MPAKKSTKKAIKKELTKKATLMQRKALKGALENGGKISPAMRAAGYSEAMAKNPQKLKESDGWQSLMKGLGLSDNDLLRKSKEHLEATTLQQFSFPGDVEDVVIIKIFEEIPGMKVLHIQKLESIRAVTDEKDKKKAKPVTYVVAKTAFVKAPEYTVQDRALDKQLRIRGAYKGDASMIPGVAVLVNNVLNDTKERYGI